MSIWKISNEKVRVCGLNSPLQAAVQSAQCLGKANGEHVELYIMCVIHIHIDLNNKFKKEEKS